MVFLNIRLLSQLTKSMKEIPSLLGLLWEAFFYVIPEVVVWRLVTSLGPPVALGFFLLRCHFPSTQGLNHLVFPCCFHGFDGKYYLLLLFRKSLKLGLRKRGNSLC